MTSCSPASGTGPPAGARPQWSLLSPSGLATAGTGLASADPNGQMHGNPTAAAPYWRYQHQQDCGLMAVADVVGQLAGREPTRLGIELRGVFTKSEAHRGGI